MRPLPFSPTALAECAEREVRQRERVYARQVERGKMTRSFADEQIAMMRQIAEDYRALAPADPQPLLSFEEKQ